MEQKYVLPQECLTSTRFINTPVVWEYRGSCTVIFDNWTETEIRILSCPPDTFSPKFGKRRLLISDGVVRKSCAEYFRFETPRICFVVRAEDIRAIFDGVGQAICEKCEEKDLASL